MVLKEGRQTGDLVDIVQKVVQLTINRRQEDQLSKSVVQIGNNGRESSVASLMCSQFKSYENEILDTRTNISPFKKATYLFGAGLAIIATSSLRFSIHGQRPRYSGNCSSMATLSSASARVRVASRVRPSWLMTFQIPLSWMILISLVLLSSCCSLCIRWRVFVNGLRLIRTSNDQS